MLRLTRPEDRKLLGLGGLSVIGAIALAVLSHTSLPDTGTAPHLAASVARGDAALTALPDSNDVIAPIAGYIKPLSRPMARSATLGCQQKIAEAAVTAPVFFDALSDIPSKDQFGKIQRIADMVAACPDVRISVKGNAASSVPTEELRLLNWVRAINVIKAMQDMGYDIARYSADETAEPTVALHNQRQPVDHRVTFHVATDDTLTAANAD